jgi:hypothetical protein
VRREIPTIRTRWRVTWLCRSILEKTFVGSRQVPQGLKPTCLLIFNGTTEVVPSPTGRNSTLRLRLGQALCRLHSKHSILKSTFMPHGLKRFHESRQSDLLTFRCFRRNPTSIPPGFMTTLVHCLEQMRRHFEMCADRLSCLSTCSCWSMAKSRPILASVGWFVRCTNSHPPKSRHIDQHRFLLREALCDFCTPFP